MWTGGAGHTERDAAIRATFQEPFTDEVIDAWLRSDFAVPERALSLLMAPQARLLPQNVVDGALDGGFNCGTELLTASSSGFARALLALDFQKASTEILRWCMVAQNGKKVPNQGLLNRRRAEAALILSPDAPQPSTGGYLPVCAAAICNPDDLHELEQEQLAAFIEASRDEDYGARDWQHDGSDPLDDRDTRDTDPAPPFPFDPSKIT